ncbi:Hypothetical_protein [Hexamita inflata]|uniref:Hypothetical_protein n=1 Tax=Hexamita inflata TaxID=28002 RepID=A0AA86RA41_9EUKA|nr:Hypothetical protein HINF_LOCUS29062 [Hexamita inflata]CAI9974639.1 Hypothetical protein HINF_LOCUS62284 [Hexamita inflata]CAI9974641.1 Hypothetical protein HINF_LOCUS62286 [Hexamita inflata]
MCILLANNEPLFIICVPISIFILLKLSQLQNNGSIFEGQTLSYNTIQALYIFKDVENTQPLLKLSGPLITLVMASMSKLVIYICELQIYQSSALFIGQTQTPSIIIYQDKVHIQAFPTIQAQAGQMQALPDTYEFRAEHQHIPFILIQPDILHLTFEHDPLTIQQPMLLVQFNYYINIIIAFYYCYIVRFIEIIDQFIIYQVVFNDYMVFVKLEYQLDRLV